MKATFPVLAFVGLSALAFSTVSAQQQTTQPPTTTGTTATTTGATATTGSTGAKTTNDGVFTDAQTKRGGEVYQMTCSACHDAQLTGSGAAPPLTGPDFSANWKDETVGSLVERIQSTMPADNPGTLSRQQAADLASFILNFNKYPTGTTELSTNDADLRAIKIAPLK